MKVDMNYSKIPGFDGVKALALFLICLRHAAYGFEFYNQKSGFLDFYGVSLYPAFVNGWVGIDLFFVLCGLVIARSWLFNPDQSYKDYVLRRMFRILPLYLLVSVLCVIGFFPFYQTAEGVSLFSKLYHLFLIPDFFIPDIDIVLGSVAAEVKFFLMMPLLLGICFACKKTPRALLIMLAALVIIGFCFRVFSYGQFINVHDYYLDYYMFFLYCRIAFVYCLDPIVLGVGIAYLEHVSRKDERFLMNLSQAKTLFWAGMGALLFWLCIDEHLKNITFYDAAFQPIVTGLIMAMIVCGTVFGGAPQCLSGNLAQHMSRLSYAVYLVHIPLVPLSYIVTRYVFMPIGTPLSYFVQFVIFSIFYTLFSWALSEVLQRYVEKKIFLKKKVKT